MKNSSRLLLRNSNNLLFSMTSFVAGTLIFLGGIFGLLKSAVDSPDSLIGMAGCVMASVSLTAMLITGAGFLLARLTAPERCPSWMSTAGIALSVGASLSGGVLYCIVMQAAASAGADLTQDALAVFICGIAVVTAGIFLAAAALMDQLISVSEQGEKEESLLPSVHESTHLPDYER